MSISTYLADKLNDHVLRNTAYTQPTTVYLALFNTDPTAAGSGDELTVTLGYARAACTFGASASRVAANTGEIVFTNSGGGDWAEAAYSAVFDASTAGNLLYFGPLTAARTCLDGGTLTFAIGAITHTLT